jgi:hypothetical protein
LIAASCFMRFALQELRLLHLQGKYFVLCRSSSEDVGRSGRWAPNGSSAALWLSYLGSFVAGVVLGCAGFSHGDTALYHLHRASLEPPQELQRKIFPFLEEQERLVNEVIVHAAICIVVLLS